ncbi:flagellar protein FlgN [Microbacterium sp. zg.Y1090]|uniref:flagellar protein FlgN n=1 Tax=Microbacterium TaxID=33882 RepID=UPI00214BCC50|nr:MULTISPECIES: flagellar protein FlgN [unclassified Microbacterium]MCR2813970.1 flagellar protein FlgN [Microbacterium sp. zg.Y1084]MCR2819244.1 flagellar protein FlgN [Microbacterium sp. zg.Y1090]MDL5487161.1 flagellar protein FlgN [Microbacterium sp. zg-Y1211]WIM28226.1 flagellar protein FlgN [Microbacterium sp. zg-Y1090]
MQLWQERELLELLIFKLEEQRLLLEAGSMRWIHFASREVEQVLERLRVSGIGRDVEVAAVAREWGVPEVTTLSGLVSAAPTDAWREVFAEHRVALTACMSEIAQLKDSNEGYLRAAARAVDETLASLAASTGEYTTHGERAREDTARIVDKEM